MPENVVEKVAKMSQNDPKMTPKGSKKSSKIQENQRKSEKIKSWWQKIVKNPEKWSAKKHPRLMSKKSSIWVPAACSAPGPWREGCKRKFSLSVCYFLNHFRLQFWKDSGPNSSGIFLMSRFKSTRLRGFVMSRLGGRVMKKNWKLLKIRLGGGRGSPSKPLKVPLKAY